MNKEINNDDCMSEEEPHTEANQKQQLLTEAEIVILDLRKEIERLGRERDDCRICKECGHTMTDLHCGEIHDQLRAENATLRAAIGKLNGCRNKMANAFNQYGAAMELEDEQAAAQMFWEADDEFDAALSASTETLKEKLKQ